MSKVIEFTQKGDYKKTEKFLHRLVESRYRNKLDKYGKMGVEALKAATPKDTGKTADSWKYEIIEEKGRLSIYWINTNINKYVNIALILQYGHATRNGGWVEGRDYINPAIQPIFDKMADEAWKEMVSK